MRALPWLASALVATSCSYPDAVFSDDGGHVTDASSDAIDVGADGEVGDACTLCGSSCVDLATDAKNCGTCGRMCDPGRSCVGGVCRCTGAGCCSTDGDCGSGAKCCSTACVLLASDPTNCGSCGRLCGDGATCNSGACVCSAGLVYCSSRCVNLSSDWKNCGTCGTICSSKVCTSGSCAP